MDYYHIQIHQLIVFLIHLVHEQKHNIEDQVEFQVDTKIII